MDFTKFVDVLVNRSLYFCRSDLMKDPFEGNYTSFMIEKYLEQAKDQKDEKLIRSHLINSPNEWKKTSFLNCWHMDDIEPYSMWKSYTTSNQAIVIQSTYNKLVQSVANNKKYSVFIGKVKYIDYKKSVIPFGNAFDPLLHKRHNFKHESELRAIVVDFRFLGGDKEPRIGHRVELDLQELIEEIRTAPTAPDWFKNIVQTLMTKFDLNKPVVNSELDEKPPSF
ncbi:MAG: hypothetical protein IIA83_00590 [Thaumarchaeota archaeon]|nr:hypothetical protein [Nitrososphaerota archaeon]